MFDSRDMEEAALYFLYMMADGEISDGEMKLFDEICKNMDLSEEDKENIADKCKKRAENNPDILKMIQEEKIEEQVGERYYYGADKGKRGRIIWNLVNLGYADSYYSKEEKTIVKYFVENWSVDSGVYREFKDIADTILALTKQKAWIVSTFPAEEREEKVLKIDHEIEELLDDAKLTIREYAD